MFKRLLGVFPRQVGWSERSPSVDAAESASNDGIPGRGVTSNRILAAAKESLSDKVGLCHAGPENATSRGEHSGTSTSTLWSKIISAILMYLPCEGAGTVSGSYGHCLRQSWRILALTNSPNELERGYLGGHDDLEFGKEGEWFSINWISRTSYRYWLNFIGYETQRGKFR